MVVAETRVIRTISKRFFASSLMESTVVVKYLSITQEQEPKSPRGCRCFVRLTAGRRGADCNGYARWTVHRGSVVCSSGVAPVMLSRYSLRFLDPVVVQFGSFGVTSHTQSPAAQAAAKHHKNGLISVQIALV